MRFLDHEHAAITAALRARDIDPATVLFVKRRGRLHVVVPGRDDTFAFFRKKATRIDEAHEWEHRTDYFLGLRNDVPCDWSGVMIAFNAWLDRH